MNESRAEDSDHRPRVAQMRRDQRRQQILSVVGENYPGPAETPVTLDDVLKAAQISKGTFYKYFSSLDDAVSTHGAALASQMIVDMDIIYSPLESPVERVSMGCQLFLYRGIKDRNWAAFISHIQDLPRDNLLLRYILADLENGRKRGNFRISGVDTTAALVIGMTFAALKQISTGNGSQDFIRETVTMMLRGLGVREAKVAPALKKAETLLFERGPAVLSWWRER